MKTKQIVEKKTVYICKVCGYDSFYINGFKKHEEIHNGRNRPFEVGDSVRWLESYETSEMGHSYTETTTKTGLILKLKNDDHGNKALVELPTEERAWVYVFQLGDKKEG